MANRARDWLRDAERDIEAAVTSGRAGHHNWACFEAQQAAEKAVKALHLHHKQEAWGHSVKTLLEALPDSVEVPGSVIERAQVLDTFYVPTRYPNAHHAGATFELYGPLQSREAIDHAREIVGFIRSQMA